MKGAGGKPGKSSEYGLKRKIVSNVSHHVISEEKSYVLYVND